MKAILIDYLTDPSFQGVNRLFVLLFENMHTEQVTINIFFPTLEIKDYNVMIDGKNFLDQPIKHDTRIYDSIRKNTTGQGNDYTTVHKSKSCLLDYVYFKIYYKILAIYLSKLQALDADPKAMQRIIFTEI